MTISLLGQLLREKEYDNDLETKKVEKQNTFSPSKEERKVLCPLRALFLRPSDQELGPRQHRSELYHPLRKESCKFHTELFREKNHGAAPEATSPRSQSLEEALAGNPSPEHLCKGPTRNAGRRKPTGHPEAPRHERWGVLWR